jgi:hypothetical protein
MSYITAYGVVMEGLQGKLPIYESIESLYDHVDEFIVVDASKYDRIDLSKYGKVKRHVRTKFPCFDDPFGALYNTALKLVDSELCLFLDFDEIFSFKSENLKDIIKMYPLDSGAGIAFSLLNYYCSRNFKVDGCSSKGPHVFKNRDNIFHDLLQGYWQPVSQIRRTNIEIDKNDGVRICNQDGHPMGHYPPIPLDVVTIHHTSHLDPLSKMARSIIQFNHVCTIDLPMFAPYDMRVSPRAIERIYEVGRKKIENKSLILHSESIPHQYESNVLLEKYIERCEIQEFNPTEFAISC